VGLVASGTNIRFNLLRVWDDAEWVDTLGRWQNHVYRVSGSSDRLKFVAESKLSMAFLKNMGDRHEWRFLKE